ncbi:hypothetical protein GEMRC1_002371 [Eukaryota sp. GEM-RC1]
MQVVPQSLIQPVKPVVGLHGCPDHHSFIRSSSSKAVCISIDDSWSFPYPPDPVLPDGSTNAPSIIHYQWFDPFLRSAPSCIALLTPLSPSTDTSDVLELIQRFNSLPFSISLCIVFVLEPLLGDPLNSIELFQEIKKPFEKYVSRNSLFLLDISTTESARSLVDEILSLCRSFYAEQDTQSKTKLKKSELVKKSVCRC